MAMVALTAFVRVASASASLHIRSCEGESGRTNCAPTTGGTEIRAFGEFKFPNGLTTNTCSVDLTAEVTNISTANESENLVFSITNVQFRECSLAEARILNEPWSMTLNGAEFPNGKISDLEFALDIPVYGECRFGLDATHKITGEWINDDFSRFGVLTISEVSDPEMEAATNILVDKP
jgi:hypothetical protein